MKDYEGRPEVFRGFDGHYEGLWFESLCLFWAFCLLEGMT
jgi:hypothetical protein